MAIDPSRILLPPLPTPGPHFLADVLHALPLWALTSEQKELRLSLAAILLHQAPQNPDCLAAVQSLLALAFQEDPFDDASAALLETTQSAHPFLPAKAAVMLRLLRAAPKPAEDDVRFEDIRVGGDTDLIVRYLEIAAKDRTNAIFRLAPAFYSLCRLPDAAEARRLLTGFAPNLPPSLFARLMAEFACLRLPPETALPLVLDLERDTWGLFAAIAASHCLERLGEREKALAACLAVRNILPHHVNLTLRAYELAKPRIAPPPPGRDEAAVCLYSLNKAELFKECLTHLAQTELGGSLVAVLDNGSTDHTPEMLATAANLFPAGRFLSVRLPVNVGAPGARNWLLSLPETKTCRHVVFLDDDAFPQADWLPRLLLTARENPAAGAVGCAITDMDGPRDHQAADFNLFPPQKGQGSLPDVKERIFVCEPCRGAPDVGLYAYTRPCLSVSGCCHALPRTSIEAVGGFDIRFNPTQFDDLDRDIRAFLAGRPGVYTGGVRVAHKQGTSLAKAQTPAQVAQVIGNKIKLEYKISDADADRLWRENLALLERDLTAKNAALQSV
jgi:GT2 family glycosyltransferase